MTETDNTSETDWLAERFEAHRQHLRAVAYRMLGSMSEADDVVQDAWLRMSRADTSDVENMRGWLTTVVARLSLDALRARKQRRENSVGVQLPEPILGDPLAAARAAPDPESHAMLADSIGLAMLVVLESLNPAERLAFVLHDVFAVPFEEIAPIVDRTPTATRQLASRARRRIRGSKATSDVDLRAQWRVVDAFRRASEEGDFDALVAVLDPDVLVRADYGRVGPTGSVELRGARAVAAQAISFRRMAPNARPVSVNGGAGLMVLSADRPYALLAFTVRSGRIVEIDILADAERLTRLYGRQLV